MIVLIQEVLFMEHEEFRLCVFDLHESGSTKGQNKLQVFWDEVAKYIKEDCGTAVDAAMAVQKNYHYMHAFVIFRYFCELAFELSQQWLAWVTSMKRNYM